MCRAAFHRFGARLIVGADGHTSACRVWAGFEVRRDPQRMIVAGTLIQGFGAPADRISSIMDPVGSRAVGGQKWSVWTAVRGA